MNILLVEDNDALREVTAEVLMDQGYNVYAIPSAEALGEMAIQSGIDLAVLDLNLPGEDGLSLARRLRQAYPRMGIVMVTVRHTLQDRIQGYEKGADLYLTKPTAPEELCAAIRALYKRMQLPNQAAHSPGVLMLDLVAYELRGPNGSVRLSQAEASLLSAMARAPQNQLDSWQVQELLGIEAAPRNVLDTRISRLRKKFEEAGAHPQTFMAIRGVGYRLGIAVQVL